MNPPQHSKAVIAAPFGSLMLEASDSHLLNILVSIETSGLSAPTTPLLLEAARQLNAYFNNPLCQFSLPILQQGTRYQHGVWQALSAISPGSVKSYGQLAAELNSGARAVAGVCRANRFAVIIPCHRVIAVNGIGGYCGVAMEKRWGQFLTATQAEKSRLKTAPTAVESLMAQSADAIDMIPRVQSILDIKRWLLRHEGYEFT